MLLGPPLENFLLERQENGKPVEHKRLKKVYNSVSCISFMSEVTDKSLKNISWSALRVKAQKMGVPAWKLAEEMTFHVTEDKVAIQGLSKS